jgi:hypothetical protein
MLTSASSELVNSTNQGPPALLPIIAVFYSIISQSGPRFSPLRIATDPFAELRARACQVPSVIL